MLIAVNIDHARLLGVDVNDEHLARARARCARFGARARFEHRSIYELGLPDGTFDLVVCRHVLQAIPHPERVVAELARVTRRGGGQPPITEDYLMSNLEPPRPTSEDF